MHHLISRFFLGQNFTIWKIKSRATNLRKFFFSKQKGTKSPYFKEKKVEFVRKYKTNIMSLKNKGILLCSLAI
jgi:hypothetical protein